MYMYDIESTFLSPLSTCSMLIANTGIINYSSILFVCYIRSCVPGCVINGRSFTSSGWSFSVCRQCLIIRGIDFCSCCLIVMVIGGIFKNDVLRIR